MSELLNSDRDAIWPFDMPTPSQRSLQIGGYRLEDSDASVCGQVWSTVLGESIILCAAKCQRVDTVEGMVTGDHLKTAKHIAKKCVILTCVDHVCMAGTKQ